MNKVVLITFFALIFSLSSCSNGNNNKTDNGNTNGSARWMVKTGNTLSVDPDRNYFHFSGSSYYSNTNGKDRKITEKQYYDGINSIIKDYTKLKAISIK